MNLNNKMQLKFLSISKNEAFARNVVGCFVLQLNPSLAELADIKTAVSEAVTNCIVHGYGETVGEITLEAEICDSTVHIKVFDQGVGISDLSVAMEPFYTTKPEEERSGMGFTIMQSFMDNVSVKSALGKGTEVCMKKNIGEKKEGA